MGLSKNFLVVTFLSLRCFPHLLPFIYSESKYFTYFIVSLRASKRAGHLKTDTGILCGAPLSSLWAKVNYSITPPLSVPLTWAARRGQEVPKSHPEMEEVQRSVMDVPFPGKSRNRIQSDNWKNSCKEGYKTNFLMCFVGMIYIFKTHVGS